MEWDGFDLVMMTSMLTLAFFYLGLSYFVLGGLRLRDALKTSSAKPSTPLIIFSILGGLSLSILIIGITFKFLFWAGADEMLFIGMTALLVMLIWAIVFRQFGKTAKSKARRGPALDTGLLAGRPTLTSFRPFFVRIVAWTLVGAFILGLIFSGNVESIRKFPQWIEDDNIEMEE